MTLRKSAMKKTTVMVCKCDRSDNKNNLDLLTHLTSNSDIIALTEYDDVFEDTQNIKQCWRQTDNKVSLFLAIKKASPNVVHIHSYSDVFRGPFAYEIFRYGMRRLGVLVLVTLDHVELVEADFYIVSTFLDKVKATDLGIDENKIFLIPKLIEAPELIPESNRDNVNILFTSFLIKQVHRKVKATRKNKIYTSHKNEV